VRVKSLGFLKRRPPARYGVDNRSSVMELPNGRESNPAARADNDNNAS
jgi:hypothetical protein